MRFGLRFISVVGVNLVMGVCALGAATPQPASAPASNRAGLTVALHDVLEAIVRGDDAAVADSMLLPVKLPREQVLLYARRLILGSRLEWLMAEKFGATAARQTTLRGQVEFISRLDPDVLTWDTATPLPASAAVGSVEEVIGRPADRKGGWVVMARTAGGWKLDRTGASVALLAMHLEDAPWRNGVLQRVIDGLKSGQLGTAEAVGEALILHAPLDRLKGQKADRSTPEGAIVAIFEAMENGDEAVVADSFQYVRESDDGAARKQFAERVVADRKLARALLAKFGPEQGARMEASGGLKVGWLDIYRNVPWVVDGDIARAAIEQDRYGHRYDVAMRMIRRNGIWRIEYPPTDLGEWKRPKTKDEMEMDQWMADRGRRENEMLAHLDRYPTPGSVLEALEYTRAQEHQVDAKMEARQVDEQVKAARKQLATQPAKTPQEAFDQQMQLTILELSAALVHQDAKAAATFYVADGDDGAYVLARETRALAIYSLIEAADKEIDSGSQRAMGEWHDVADDAYGLAMIEWKVEGDRATGKPPGGAGPDEFWLPTLRRVGGAWKIDVTGEIDGNAKVAADRAVEETKKIEQLTRDVKGLKFKTIDEFKAAVGKSGIKGANRPTG